MFHIETLDKVSNIKSDYSTNIFGRLDLAQHARMLQDITTIINLLIDTKVTAETVDLLHSKRVVYGIINHLAYCAVNALVKCDHPVPNEMLADVFGRVKPTTKLNKREQRLIPFIHQTLYTRNRGSALELR
jgi:hypothetical protein